MMKVHDQSSKPALLEVRNLQAGFLIQGNTYLAVDDVSFQLEPGKIYGVVGESGCGKSVMSLSIMDLLPKENGRIVGGEILLEGRNLVGLTEDEMNQIRGNEISMIFQEPMTALNPVFTIGFQLEEVIHNHRRVSKEEARRRCIELLEQVGIPRAADVMNEYPHQLSGGMRQRVMIAMAMANEPKLLIADEPTTALDVTIQAQILELIKQIQKEKKMTVLLITHDLGVIAEMADEVFVMYAGQIVEHCNVDEVFYQAKHPYLRGLLRSIPRLGERKENLDTIDGLVPSLVNMPKVGCRFANRCKEGTKECTTVTPLLAEVESGHTVRCLQYTPCQPSQSVGVAK
nr:ABC transporter ATP-binding protein [Rubeoparvulum massiliense]